MASSKRKRSRLASSVYIFSSDSNSSDEDHLPVSNPVAVRRTDRRLCVHCGELLSLKTYMYHKRLYFNKEQDKWIKVGTAATVTVQQNMDAESPPHSPNFTFEDSFEGCLSPQLSSEDSSNSSESSETENEVWNEGELSEAETDGTGSSKLREQAKEPESRPLASWLLHFLFSMQAVFHLSDTVISFFLAFFRTYLSILGRFSKVCAEIAQCLPPSLYKLRALENKLNFQKYVVCKICHTIYPFSDCVEGPKSSRRSRSCHFQRYPLHPQRRMREPCGATLLKTVELASGKTYFYPRLTYCYLNLKVCLQAFLNRPGFYHSCNQWASRQVEPGVLFDVYDGRIWRDFLSVNQKPFLSESGNLALMLNMDFFQPMKHVQYSLGAIYMTILNLPREVRNKQENVILVGLIPGPREPEHDLNSFLEPLVNDLLELWDGVDLDVHGLNTKKRVRCALVSIACDLPAGRKVCGFLNHSARLGCSRCLKEFPGVVGSMDYSGFDREKWKPRTGSEHFEVASQLKNFKTKSEMERAESASGCRYSVLLKLPYINLPRMLIVDPMHNLFLGSAKHFMKSILLGRDILPQAAYDVIQKRVDSTVAPSDIGRIPNKICSGFSSFTADQWKNWVVYFSLFALRDLLPSNILECWRHFVLACRVLCKKHIKLEEVQLGDALLLKFCKRTESIFGKEVVTPNMHMHCHLRECIQDFGPLYSFWLYAFERYNGILGDVPNNNHSIEVQIMKHFLSESQTLSSPLPQEFHEELQPLLPIHKQTGSVAETLQVNTSCLGNFGADSGHVKLPGKCMRKVFSSTQKEHLQEMYSKLNSARSSDITLAETYLHYTYAFVNGKILGSYKTRMASSSVVLVEWNELLFGPCNHNESHSPSVLRAARINFFCKSNIVSNGEMVSNLFVSLSWYKYHPKNVSLGKPITVWFCDLFESDGIYSVIPIQFIKYRTVSIIDKLDGQSVLFVCPCLNRV